MSEQFDVVYTGAGAEERATRLSAHAPLSVEHISDAEHVLDRLSDLDLDCIVSEQFLARCSGLDVLRRIREADPRIPFVLVAAEGSETLASEAISAGVTDYLVRTGDDETDAERAAEAVSRVASRYRAEQDVAMLNDLARNVYERVTDAFFAVDRNWRFTYVNERAADLLDLDTDVVLGETIWDVFPTTVGTTFYTENHRAMAIQEPVTFSEYVSSLDETFSVRTFPSKNGLSVHFQRAVDERSTSDGEHLLELTNLLSHELLNSIADVKTDVEGAQEDCSCDTDELQSAIEALDRMAELVNHSLRLANRP